MNALTYAGVRVPKSTVSKRVDIEKTKRLFERFMDALMETRYRQARRVIDDHVCLLPNAQLKEPVWTNPRVAVDVTSTKTPIRCPITGHPCEGDLSHLCEEYGCARKAGLSPSSTENL